MKFILFYLKFEFKIIWIILNMYSVLFLNYLPNDFEYDSDVRLIYLCYRWIGPSSPSNMYLSKLRYSLRLLDYLEP